MTSLKLYCVRYRGCSVFERRIGGQRSASAKSYFKKIAQEISTSENFPFPSFFSLIFDKDWMFLVH